MSTKKELTNKQKLFLEILEANAGNVSIACKKADTSRQTHYDWIDKSDTYKNRVEDIQEGLIDFAESMLMKKIKDGDTTSNIFFLKTKGKNRGYVERAEYNSTSSVTVIPKIEVVEDVK